MRSHTRVITTAVIFIIILSSFIHLKRDEIPDYLPQQAHDYFHPGESPEAPPPAERPIDHSGEKSEDTSVTSNRPSQPTQGSNPAGETPSVSNESPQSIEGGTTSAGKPKRPKSLNQVLDEFLKRPIQSYDESLEANTKTCPTEGVNFDRNAVNGNKDSWPTIPSSQISEWRQNIAAHLLEKQRISQSKVTTSKRSPPHGQIPKDMRASRGIVMAAGDRASTIRARTNIRFLNSYNCTLPVEIFHFNNELSASDKSLLEGLGSEGSSEMKVTVRLVGGVEKGNGWKAFQIKGAAIQQSSFDEILYLDTDSYLLRDPTYLFEGKHWKETGLLLWPDYTKSHPTNPLWRLLGQQCRNEFEGESGQILISRIRHQDLMWLVEYFALHHAEFYGFMGGDRDSFRAAALLLQKPYTGPGRLNAAAGTSPPPGNPSGGGHTMLQSDPEGKWMFVHANLIKHSRFPKPLWQKIHRAAKDRYFTGSAYGNINAPNDRIGDGVKLDVSSTPRMATTMTPFQGFNESVVVVEDWDTYEELRGFEEKWFGFGGVH